MQAFAAVVCDDLEDFPLDGGDVTVNDDDDSFSADTSTAEGVDSNLSNLTDDDDEEPAADASA